MQSLSPLNTEPLKDHPKYRKVRDIAQGTFGFVQLALNTSLNQLVAIKFIERGKKITKYVEREILNQRRLLHPHVIELREVFLTPDYLAIAMEFAAGGDMYNLVTRVGGLFEADARWFFQQLIVAVDFCHRAGVANRDIKLENTLLDGSSTDKPLIKICDFGYSKHEKLNSAPGSRVGTPAYLAPEIILTKQGKTYDGKLADVWSCGVMLYTMLAAAYPFSRPEDAQLKPAQKMHVQLSRTLKMEYELPATTAVSPECADLLSHILVAAPERRYTIAQIQAHPWFMRDLPPGVAELNNRMIAEMGANEFALPPGSQSLKETEQIVEEAMNKQPTVVIQVSTAEPYSNLHDGYIDEAIQAANQAAAYLSVDGW